LGGGAAKRSALTTWLGHKKSKVDFSQKVPKECGAVIDGDARAG
jgi:hypothetical protein